MRSFLSSLATCLVCLACEGVEGATRCKSYGPQICFASDAEEGDEPVPVPLTIEKNKTLADIPAMTKEWTVSFELQQTEEPPKDKWLTIFRIGTKKDDDKKDRYPGVFFHSKAGIYVRNHLSGKKDFGGKMVYGGEELKKRSLTEDDWTSVKVSQEMEDDKLMFKAEINGEEVLSAEQTKPYEGAAVVYVGDSHYDAFPGTLRNLVINLGGNTLSTEED